MFPDLLNSGPDFSRFAQLGTRFFPIRSTRDPIFPDFGEHAHQTQNMSWSTMSLPPAFSKGRTAPMWPLLHRIFIYIQRIEMEKKDQKRVGNLLGKMAICVDLKIKKKITNFETRRPVPMINNHQSTVVVTNNPTTANLR